RRSRAPQLRAVEWGESPDDLVGRHESRANGDVDDEPTGRSAIWLRCSGIEVPRRARSDPVEVLLECPIDLIGGSTWATRLASYEDDSLWDRVFRCNPCGVHGRIRSRRARRGCR